MNTAASDNFYPAARGNYYENVMRALCPSYEDTQNSYYGRITTIVLEYLGFTQEQTKAELKKLATRCLALYGEFYVASHALFKAMIQAENALSPTPDKSIVAERLKHLEKVYTKVDGILQPHLTSWHKDPDASIALLITNFQVTPFIRSLPPSPPLPVHKAGAIFTHLSNYGTPKMIAFHRARCETIQFVPSQNTSGQKAAVITFSAQELEKLAADVIASYEIDVEQIIDASPQVFLEILSDLPHAIPHCIETSMNKGIAYYCFQTGGRVLYEKFLKEGRGLPEIATTTAVARKEKEITQKEKSKYKPSLLLLPENYFPTKMTLTKTEYADLLARYPLAQFAHTMATEGNAQEATSFDETYGRTLYQIGSRYAIAIPVLGRRLPPPPLSIPATAMVAVRSAENFLKDYLNLSIEETEKLLNGFIDQGFLQWHEAVTKEHDPAAAAEVKLAIQILNHLRRALLPTLIAGLKKTTGGQITHSFSHFHEPFQQIFLKGLVTMIATSLKEVYRQREALTGEMLLSHLAPIIINSFTSMAKQFKTLVASKTPATPQRTTTPSTPRSITAAQAAAATKPSTPTPRPATTTPATATSRPTTTTAAQAAALIKSPSSTPRPAMTAVQATATPRPTTATQKETKTPAPSKSQ